MDTTASFTNMKIMKPECLMSLQTMLRTEGFINVMNQKIFVRFCNKKFHTVNFIIWETL